MVRATLIATPSRRVRPTLSRKLTERTLDFAVRAWRLTWRHGERIVEAHPQCCQARNRAQRCGLRDKIKKKRACRLLAQTTDPDHQRSVTSNGSYANRTSTFAALQFQPYQTPAWSHHAFRPR